MHVAYMLNTRSVLGARVCMHMHVVDSEACLMHFSYLLVYQQYHKYSMQTDTYTHRHIR
jgi:hypothetical protein